MSFNVFNADAYNKVKEFDDLVVDHIVTDPPYNIAQDNNFQTLKGRAGIDFGDWDKNFDLTSWIKPYTKVLKKGGSFIVFCSYKYISDIVRAMEHSDLVVKDVLVWQKSNPMPRNVERRYVQDLEFAVWAVKKGEKWVFKKPKETPYLRGVYQFPICSGKERTLHPTQKPVSLMKSILKTHTREGDVVLDCFMGSGSTGVACLEIGRSFVGIEKDEKYFKIAEKRLKETGILVKKRLFKE